MARRRKFKRDHKHIIANSAKKESSAAQKLKMEQQGHADDDRNDVGGDSEDEEDDNLAGFVLRKGVGSGRGGDSEEEEDDDEDDNDVEDLEDFDEFDDEEEGDEEEEEEELDEDEDDDEDKEDEDVEQFQHHDNDQQRGKKQRKRKLLNDIAQHKKELEEAMARDPAFFKFLQENDEELLKFGEGMDVDGAVGGEDEEDLQAIMKGEVAYGDDEDDDDEEGEQDEDNDRKDDTKRRNSNNSNIITEVTKSMITTWTKSIQNPVFSLRSAKKVILAFKAVVQEGETESEDQEVVMYRIGDRSGEFMFVCFLVFGWLLGWLVVCYVFYVVRGWI